MIMSLQKNGANVCQLQQNIVFENQDMHFMNDNCRFRDWLYVSHLTLCMEVRTMSVKATRLNLLHAK